MSLRTHIRFWVIFFWILALMAPTPAQTSRRKAKTPRVTTPYTVPPTEPQSNAILTRQAQPKGWVWVTQTIDLTQQLGGEENIMTLDGEPLPSMEQKRVTLGLVIDKEGHIVTRLIDVTPSKPPLTVLVRSFEGRPTPAKFLGMDAATGFCVLKVDGSNLIPANFSSPETLPSRLNIRLYGFHPNQGQNFKTAHIVGSPRLNIYHGQITRAMEDFRYHANNPIYHLLYPKLTPVQDCSLILERDNAVFGMAIYDTGSGGPHLVYPISRVRSIAQPIIKSHQSIAHGWLGAAGRDAAPAIQTLGTKSYNDDLGVRVTAVHPDSPAEIAGVRAKDILLSVNDLKVQTLAQLATAIRQIPADSEITLKVKRGNEYKSLKAKLVPAPAIEPEQQIFAFARSLETMEEELKTMPVNDPKRQRLESRVGVMRIFVGAVTSTAPPEIRLRVLYGFEVQPLTSQLMNYFAVTNGILVSSVFENNKAARAGLIAGDVIVKVGDTPITNFPTLINALDQGSSESIAITVSRRREQRKVILER